MTAALDPSPPPTAPARKTLWELIGQRLQGEDQPAGKAMLIPFTLSNAQAHKIVRAGISSEVLRPLGELLEMGPTTLAPLIGVDRATARRYSAARQDLPPHSAETVLHLAEIEALAKETFESESDALGWLKRPHPLLDGETPLQAAATSYGAQRVREILVAIKYGGVV